MQQLPHTPILPLWSWLYPNSLKTQEKFTGKPSSEFFIISLAPKLTHSHMEMSTTIYLDSQMLMEHHRSTVMPFLAMHSSLMEQQFPGPHATKSWSLCLLPRLNMWQPPTPQKNASGFEDLSSCSLDCHPHLPSSIVTTKPLST